MANIKSQIKRNRQNDKVRARNKTVRSGLKTDLKKFQTALAEGDKDAAAEAFRVATKSLDQAASKNILHDNNASNKKSRMAKKLNAM